MNAKDELIRDLERIGNIPIKCAIVFYGDTELSDLKCNYTKTSELSFYLRLNIEYDDTKVSTPKINGRIWLSNGEWLEKSRNDRGWQHKHCPDIPKFLKDEEK